jgi:hypothetical protein
MSISKRTSLYSITTAYRISTSPFQARLFEDSVQGARRQVVAWFSRNRDATGLGGVLALTMRAVPSSRKATISSCLTVGNPDRKSSIVPPPARRSMSARTGTRVPANAGIPLEMSGDEVTIGRALVATLLSASRSTQGRPLIIQ